MDKVMKTCVIINPKSTGWKSAKNTKILSELFIRSGITTVKTNMPGEAVELCSTLINQGYELIIIAGGDGTVNEVINGIMMVCDDISSRPIICVIPMGSANDFARGLGIPLDPVLAFSKVTGKQLQSVDIGCMKTNMENVDF